jgi:hypothetical protein
MLIFNVQPSPPLCHHSSSHACLIRLERTSKTRSKSFIYSFVYFTDNPNIAQLVYSSNEHDHVVCPFHLPPGDVWPTFDVIWRIQGELMDKGKGAPGTLRNEQ